MNVVYAYQPYITNAERGVSMPQQPEHAVSLDHRDRRARTWTLLTIAAFALFSILTLLLVFWGIRHDLKQVYQTLLHSEVGRIRSHAIRTVANIQDELHNNSSLDLAILQHVDYLRRNWNRTVRVDPSRNFAAVLDVHNTIRLHYNPSLEGRQLPRDWYQQEYTDDEAMDDVVLTNTPNLTSGILSFDIQVPIIVQNQTIGTYHAGLNSSWLEELYNQKKSSALSFWIWLLLVMLTFEIVAAAALYYTSRRMAILEEASKIARSRRYIEIGQLMAGIVHEIRNPLNAMCMNLHMLKRSEQLPTDLRTEELNLDREGMIQEIETQINCVEGLLRILHSYTRSDVSRPELLDLRQEVLATLNFVQSLLEHQDFLAIARMPEQAIVILMDRDRFRQILLNLLKNACEAMQAGGTIEVELRAQQHHAVLIVSDQGQGVPASLQEQIFEPFYSTKDTGTGLGLAIVRRHIEDAGGDVRCVPNPTGGTQFIIRLPLQQTTPDMLPQQTTFDTSQEIT